MQGHQHSKPHAKSLDETDRPRDGSVFGAVGDLEADDPFHFAPGFVTLFAELHPPGFRISLTAADGDGKLFNYRLSPFRDRTAAVCAGGWKGNGSKRPADRQADTNVFVHR